MAHPLKGKTIEQIWEMDNQNSGDKVMGLVYNGVSGKIYGCLSGSTHSQDACVVTEYDKVSVPDDASEYRIYSGTPRGIRFTKAWVVDSKVKPSFYKLKGCKTLDDCQKQVAEVIKLPEPLKVLGTQLATLHLANLLGISYKVSPSASEHLREIKSTMGATEWKKLVGCINRATDKVLGIVHDDKEVAKVKAEAPKEKVFALKF